MMSLSQFNRPLWWLSLPILFVLSAAISPKVNAQPITFQFEGELDYVEGPLASTFSKGERYTGLYSFDPTMLDNYGDTEFSGFARFDQSIKAMSFATNHYSTSATSGFIAHDFEDTLYYSVHFSPLSGIPLNGFIAEAMSLSWNLSSIDSAITPASKPNFDPNLPIYLIDPFETYFDAGGQVVFDPFRGLIGDPDQPLYDQNGSAVPTGQNGQFRLTFSHNGKFLSIAGHLLSIRVVPPQAALPGSLS